MRLPRPEQLAGPGLARSSVGLEHLRRHR
jgi:hypothetical protein